jgi:hypothetical protein
MGSETSRPEPKIIVPPHFVATREVSFNPEEPFADQFGSLERQALFTDFVNSNGSIGASLTLSPEAQPDISIKANIDGKRNDLRLSWDIQNVGSPRVVTPVSARTNWKDEDQFSMQDLKLAGKIRQIPDVDKLRRKELEQKLSDLDNLHFSEAMAEARIAAAQVATNVDSAGYVGLLDGRSVSRASFTFRKNSTTALTGVISSRSQDPPDGLITGFKFATRNFAAGFSQPLLIRGPTLTTLPSSLWACSKLGNNAILGVHLRNDVAYPPSDRTVGAARDSVTSHYPSSTCALALNYPGAASVLRVALLREEHGEFSADLSPAHGSLTLGAHHHHALQRAVVNPTEEQHVVGIVNYVDIGLELVHRRNCAHSRSADEPLPRRNNLNTNSSMTNSGREFNNTANKGGNVEIPLPNTRESGGNASAGTQEKGRASAVEAASPVEMRVGVSWQLNKNWLVKAVASSDHSTSLTLAARSWFIISALASVTVGRNRDGHTRTGLQFALDNSQPAQVYERGQSGSLVSNKWASGQRFERFASELKLDSQPSKVSSLPTERVPHGAMM